MSKKSKFENNIAITDLKNRRKRLFFRGLQTKPVREQYPLQQGLTPKRRNFNHLTDTPSFICIFFGRYGPTPIASPQGEIQRSMPVQSKKQYSFFGGLAMK